MVLSVPEEKVPALQALCDQEDVELCDLGRFGCRDSENDEPMLVLHYEQTEVGRLGMHFLHKGLPTPTRDAHWPADQSQVDSAKSLRPNRGSRAAASPTDMMTALTALLAHPNIASKHWLVRQYDHEVQGASVVKPLTGPKQQGPSDGAVLRPKFDNDRGVVLAGGMAPALSEHAAATGLAAQGDSYWASLAAIDEAIRNAVCVGADPTRIALLDNFCWPGCDDAHQLGALVRAAEACYDGALAYKTPFVSGKDSLNNQFTTETGQKVRIPQTLLITAMGLLPHVNQACTMNAKEADNILFLIGETASAMGGSHYVMTAENLEAVDPEIPRVNLQQGPINAASVSELIREGLACSAHDCSDGGLLVAAAEMAIATPLGLDLDLDALLAEQDISLAARAFAETPSRYLLEVSPENASSVKARLNERQVPFAPVGRFNDTSRFTIRAGEQSVVDCELSELLAAWREPLDW
jgi:phosphoribosylformylglycinamidine synthase